MHEYNFSSYLLYLLFGCGFFALWMRFAPKKQYIFQYIFVPYLSPDADTKYLQSLVNFIPVTISAGEDIFHLRSLCEIRVPNVPLHMCAGVVLPECPNIVATHSPLLNSKMLMFLSEQLVATYWPDGSSCTCEDKRARKESTHCANIEKKRGLWPEMLPWSGFHPRLKIPCRVSSVCHCWC